ncbi:MAG TPA: hypothetical protein VK741_21640 [Acetobacteraceae bacterium]|jgi:hypothetical protein|nr:hypothetical protein [Acetobacteraceae bacterium]
MINFRVLAQSYFSTRQIQKTVQAPSEWECLRLISAELESAGFYPIGILRQS